MEIRLLSRPERPAAIQLIWAAFLRYEAPDYSPEGIEAFRRFITDEASWDRLESFGAFEGGQLWRRNRCPGHRTHTPCFLSAADGAAGNRRRLWDHLRRLTPAAAVTVNASPYAVPVYRRFGFWCPHRRTVP